MEIQIWAGWASAGPILELGTSKSSSFAFGCLGPPCSPSKSSKTGAQRAGAGVTLEKEDPGLPLEEGVQMAGRDAA